MFSGEAFNPLGRFDGLGSIYAKYRPSYPLQAIDWIVERLAGLDGPIADIGAGTGILSRQLAERSFRVIGVEPNESMRNTAEKGPDPDRIDYRAGRAEATGLPAKSVAAVVAGQTFHWCDAGQSLREFHRILGPGGWVTLLWNIFDRTDQFTEQFAQALRDATPEPAILEKPHNLSGQALLEHPLFDQAEARLTPHSQLLDENGVLGRALSASFAPKDCQASERTARRLLKIFHEFSRDGLVPLRYQTHVYQAKKRNSPDEPGTLG